MLSVPWLVEWRIHGIRWVRRAMGEATRRRREEPRLNASAGISGLGWWCVGSGLLVLVLRLRLSSRLFVKSEIVQGRSLHRPVRPTTTSALYPY